MTRCIGRHNVHSVRCEQSCDDNERLFVDKEEDKQSDRMMHSVGVKNARWYAMHYCEPYIIPMMNTM